MATKFNLRGDELQLRITVNGELERTIVDLKSGSITLNIEKLFERYVGRTSNSIDERYNHTDVSLTFHPRSQAFLDLIDRIQKRAQRQLPQESLVINLVTSLQFVNGDRPKVMVPDLKFGNIPINIPAEGYVDFVLDGSSEEKIVILS